MKEYKYITITAVLFLVHLNSANAQFTNTGGGNWNTSVATVDRLSVGTTGSYPSVLFVDGANTSGSNTGNVFSTNGPGSTTTSWKMSQGGTENFRVENGSASDNIDLKAITGSMKFWTDGTQRLCITPASSSGFIGIGAGFNSPKSRLHINQGGAGNDVQFQMTTDGTNNNNSSQGLGITIIDNTLNVEFKQYENADMLFYTNSAEQVRIKSNGDMGVATASPSARLHVVGYSPPSDVSSTTAIKAICDGNDHATAVTGVYVDVTDAKPLVAGSVKGIDVIASATDATVIGINCATTLSKSQSGPTSNVIGGQFSAGAGNTDGVGISYGIAASASGAYASYGINYGGHFSAGGNTQINYGIDASAIGGGNDAEYAYGVKGTADDALTQNFGVLGWAISNTANFGVFGWAHYGNDNYGVYGKAAQGSCSAGSASNCTDAAGFFEGDVFCTTNSYYVSDSAIKSNAQPITNALSIINQLLPQSYVFDTMAAPGLVLPTGTQYGLLAQELELILPSLVKQAKNAPTTDSAGNIVHPSFQFKAINYTGLIPFLVAGIKQQQMQIDQLNQAIATCCAVMNSHGLKLFENSNNVNQKVHPVSELSAILYQNEPNPFSEKTIIRYYIPETVKNASLVFYSSTGVRIKEVILNQKGEGQVEVETGTITNGIYSYSLFVDGKNADTKRMVKIK